jgi:hypothetical protein
MPRSTKLALPALALALLAACSNSSDQAPAPIPFAQMPAALKTALCEKLYQCCSSAELMANPGIGKDVASCEATLGSYATFLLADVQQSMTGNRIIYHGDRMATCLADLRARSCSEVKMPAGEISVLSLCEGAIEPRVPAGGPCSEYWDCVGGWCEGDVGGLMDKCSAKKPDGEECDESPECASGTCDNRACKKADEGSGNICKVGMTESGH